MTGTGDGAGLMHRLVENGLEIDALRLLPYLLPLRQAIWWGCLCAWHGNQAAPAPLEDEALRATVGWLRRPGEAEWQWAERAAKADGARSPGGCCAQAVGWGGFWSAANHWTHRELHVAARLIAGAALLVVGNPQAPVAPRRVLTLGVEVARGENRWEGDPSD